MPCNALLQSRGSRQGKCGQAIHFRIGIHVGDVIVEGTNLFGDAVNVAA
jgi:class 3 adenylate cyclase